jgi:hypothetical protein
MRYYPSFIKINPCRGVVDDDKVRDKIGAFDYLMPLFNLSSFFDEKLRHDNWVEKMLMPGGL